MSAVIDLPPGSHLVLQTVAPGADAGTQALARRARIGLLAAIVLGTGRPEQFDFWQGYAKAVRDLQNGTAEKLAINDLKSGQDQLPGALRAAAQALGDDVYRLARAEIVDRLTQAGIECALDVLPRQDLATASAFEDRAVAPIDGNSEQIAANDKHDAGAHACSVLVGVAP